MYFFKKFPKSFFFGTKCHHSHSLCEDWNSQYLGAHGHHLPQPVFTKLWTHMVLLVDFQTSIVVIISVKKTQSTFGLNLTKCEPHISHQKCNREGPLKLAHSILGCAVGITDIVRPGWLITKKQRHTEINLNKIYFLKKQLNI